MVTEPPVSGPVDARRRVGSVPEGPGTRQPVTDAHSGYCTCGHDRTDHRHGACWIGWDGNPVHRARSAIACPCTSYERNLG